MENVWILFLNGVELSAVQSVCKYWRDCVTRFNRAIKERSWPKINQWNPVEAQDKAIDYYKWHHRVAIFVHHAQTLHKCSPFECKAPLLPCLSFNKTKWLQECFYSQDLTDPIEPTQEYTQEHATEVTCDVVPFSAHSTKTAHPVDLGMTRKFQLWMDGIFILDLGGFLSHRYYDMPRVCVWDFDCTTKALHFVSDNGNKIQYHRASAEDNRRAKFLSKNSTICRPRGRDLQSWSLRQPLVSNSIDIASFTEINRRYSNHIHIVGVDRFGLHAAITWRSQVILIHDTGQIEKLHYNNMTFRHSTMLVPLDDILSVTLSGEWLIFGWLQGCVRALNLRTRDDLFVPRLYYTGIGAIYGLPVPRELEQKSQSMFIVSSTIDRICKLVVGKEIKAAWETDFVVTFITMIRGLIFFFDVYDNSASPPL